MLNQIDTTYDFRLDTPPGKDPDTWSPTLCRYHKLLWGKRLPSGGVFDLVHKTAPFYLHHCSDLGEFVLSSDAVIPTFRWASSIKEMVPAEEVSDFIAIGYTIGGMMLFPAVQIEGKWTINQARGCMKSIGDRFDWTLECIRRHYAGGYSPLSEVLARYANFFELFRDFRGYAEFFLLQDLVTDDCAAVKFFSRFDGFKSPVPDSLSAYREYRDCAVGFIEARNQRIRDWSETHLRANDAMNPTADAVDVSCRTAHPTSTLALRLPNPNIPLCPLRLCERPLRPLSAVL